MNKLILAILLFTFNQCFSQKRKTTYVFSEEIAKLDTSIYDFNTKVRLQTLRDMKMIVEPRKETKVEIKFCPNCKSDLTKTAKLAQDVRECKKCNTRFYMLICNTGG